MYDDIKLQQLKESWSKMDETDYDMEVAIDIGQNSESEDDFESRFEQEFEGSPNKNKYHSIAWGEFNKQKGMNEGGVKGGLEDMLYDIKDLVDSGLDLPSAAEKVASETGQDAETLMMYYGDYFELDEGLWDNIHAKRKRGESPAKPGFR
jgi:hypothetical protein